MTTRETRHKVLAASRHVVYDAETWWPLIARDGESDMQRPHKRSSWNAVALSAAFALWVPVSTARAQQSVAVEGQPLGANVQRVVRAMESLGAPLPDKTVAELAKAGEERDATGLQKCLDPQVLLTATINPEERVKVGRGAAPAVLQQGGYTPILVKVINEAATTKSLRISSPQSGPVTAGAADLSMIRQDQRHLKVGEIPGGAPGRFLQAEMVTAQPMTANLSGLRVEYAVALLYSSESGQREAIIGFDVGQGTQDLGFRGEVPILFTVRPGIPVKLRVRDHDGAPTVAHFTFVDPSGRVYPPQPKRTAPDLFFQRQIYRADGGVVLLPPGRITVTYGRGPEYRLQSRELTVPDRDGATLDVRLERWIDPRVHGYFSGDHHIHAAGCAHYTDPTQGVGPKDMFLQVKGEGLNVGCVLNWGPCYDYQRRFFGSRPDRVERAPDLDQVRRRGQRLRLAGARTRLPLESPRPDLPWFGRHRDQGLADLDHARAPLGQGTGGRHGLRPLGLGTGDQREGRRRATADGPRQGRGWLAHIRRSRRWPHSGRVRHRPTRTATELLTRAELEVAHDRAAETLPNFAIPEMNGVGAMEVVVSVPEGVCDFMSAMDTPRIAEWNMWYHLLNCGFPLKVSGETDFPCMSGLRVGQGRVYVRLGDSKSLDFDAWCAGLAGGRSYVSDGFAHALEFTVGGKRSGDRLELEKPETVAVKAKVAFAARTPLAVAYGGIVPAGGKKLVGDTVNLHGPRRDGEFTAKGESRRVELVVNGKAVASRDVPADDRVHELDFRRQGRKE